MKQLRYLLALSVLTAGFALCQEPAVAEHGQPAEAEKTEKEIPHEMLWKWINFAILAGVLGWIVKGNLPPFFAARTEEIQKGIAEAAAIKKEADARAADMEARLARLDADIEELKRKSREEMAAEGARIRRETESQLAKIQAHAQEEIAAATKIALRDLRATSAELAIALAEQKLRASMTASAEDTLLKSFAAGLAGRQN